MLAGQTRLSAERTDPGHLSGLRDHGGALRPERQKHPYETKPDGNAVVVEEQMLKVNQNAMDQNTIVNLYRKQIGLLKTAIGRSGG